MSSGRQGPDVGRAPDWRDAQVIEATTPSGELVTALTWHDGRWLLIGQRVSVKSDYLSDVRIIVDRNGDVAPPEITEEMVDLLITLLLRDCRDYKPQVRAALEAALGGDHG